MIKKRHMLTNKVTPLLLLFIFTTTVLGDASISLDGTYGGDESDIASHGIQTLDGGYLLVGTTNSFGNGGFDYWLVKTDENGSTEWNKYYGGAGDDAATSVVQNRDGSFALAGYSNSFSDNDFDFLLIKTDYNGEMEWYKTYGGINEDRATCLIKTSEGGFALAGYSNSFNDNSYDFLLVKTDVYGNILWYNTYGGSESDKAFDLIQTDDDGFLIVGETSSFGAGNYDFWVVKTDSNGFIQWNITFGGKNHDHGKAAVQSDDGGFLIVGETSSFGAGNYDFWVVKTDYNGSLDWNRTFGWKEMDHAKAIVQSDDGCYLIAGYSEQLLYYNFQLFKINEEGYLKWKKNYSGNADIFAHSITLTTDKEYLLTGFVLIGYSNMDFFMLKTNSSSFNKSNLYPIANAGYDETAILGENVTFNASGFGPDGEIVKYRWDFDGDGIYDWESNSSDVVTHSFFKPGIYNSYLEVTDNNNLKDIDKKEIVVKQIGDGLTVSESDVNIWFYFLLAIIVFVFFIIILIRGLNVKHKLQLNRFIRKFGWFKKINIWHQYIIISFLIISLIKILISLFFNNPIIYADEYIYGVVAEKIYQGNILILGNVTFTPILIPTAYSYCLAPAYIFKDNMDIVYHVFLLINTIITSLLILPVFYIMRKFVDEKKSFITSIIVATLPVIFAHNFTLLSENLFYLLFLFSCLLIIKTFTYNKFDKCFILLSILTGLSVGLLIMTRALGVAALGGLVIVFLYKIFKNRKLASLKYSFVFLPFIPAILIGYLLYGEKTFFIGYLGSSYINKLSLFSDFSNFIEYFRLVINEINYFIIMSYGIFIAFTIFCIFHRKKLTNKKREQFSVFVVYSFFTILFLIFITGFHIMGGDNDVYSRYVSPGLPIIFMTGIIGLNLFERIKSKKKYFQLSLILIFLGVICILFLPYKIISLVNNLDLYWIYFINKIYIFDYSLLKIFQLVITVLLVFFILKLILSWYKRKELLLLKKILKHKYHIFVFVVILSGLFFIPTLDLELDYSSGSFSKTNTAIARWFVQNDPDSKIIIEDSLSAFSGGGMDYDRWRSIYVNMEFWLPNGHVQKIERENLSRLILGRNISADYIVSTHDLTSYYPLIKSYYFNEIVWSLKKQPYADWHIYKV